MWSRRPTETSTPPENRDHTFSIPGLGKEMVHTTSYFVFSSDTHYQTFCDQCNPQRFEKHLKVTLKIGFHQFRETGGDYPLLPSEMLRVDSAQSPNTKNAVQGTPQTHNVVFSAAISPSWKGPLGYLWKN